MCVCVIAAPEISFYHIIERQDCVGLGSFICLGEMHNIEILAHTADTFFVKTDIVAEIMICMMVSVD